MEQLNESFWNEEQIWNAFKDEPGSEGKTRLMFASCFGMLDRVRRLLARGARVETGTFINGVTALMGASQYGHLEVVRELLGRGANVNSTDTTFVGSNALMLAVEGGNIGGHP